MPQNNLYYVYRGQIRVGPVAKELRVNFLPPAPAWQNLGHAHPVSAQALYMEIYGKTSTDFAPFLAFLQQRLFGMRPKYLCGSCSWTRSLHELLVEESFLFLSSPCGKLVKHLIVKILDFVFDSPPVENVLPGDLNTAD